MAQKQIFLPYEEAIKYIDEADVALFRGADFPSIGWVVKTYTKGLYSHTGLMHWDGDDLKLVEQREFKGGRETYFKNQVKIFPNTIDIYKAKPTIVLPSVLMTNDVLTVDWVEKTLTPEIRREIVRTAIQLTGTKYGWVNIWEIVKGYAPLSRLVFGNKNGDSDLAKAYVCSTVVNYSYRIHYADPVTHIKDDKTTPNDLSRSFLLDYAFTVSTVANDT